MKKRSSLLDYSYPGLSPDIYQADGTLLPYHKDYILKLINSFYTTYNLKNPEAWVLDITNIGSLTTNKYLRSSDFDCHVIFDVDAFMKTNMPEVSREEALLYLDNARKEWDRAKILLPFGEHPLELYFESPESSSNTKAVGRYSLMSNTWLKEPVFFAQDDDYEVSKQKIVEEAIQMANELDASFGNIRRDIKRIEELKEVANAWPTDSRKVYLTKIEEKLNAIEEEIETAIAIRQDLIDERHEKQDPFSENEIKFKYLARFFYFYVIDELKTILAGSGGEITETALPLIKNVVASLGSAGQYWFDPSGKFYQVKLPAHNHTEWIQQNAGIDNIDHALEKGWIRARKDGDTASIDLGSLLNIPDFINDFILELNADTTFIEDAKNNYVKLSREDIAELGPAKAIIKALQEKHMALASLKQAGQVLDVNGVRVFKNPTFEQLENILDKSKENFPEKSNKHVRYVISPETNELFVWDAFAQHHTPMMEALGIEPSQHNYENFSGDITNVDEIDSLLTFQEEGGGQQKAASKHDANNDILIDFDGTIAEKAKYPETGKPMPGVQEALAKFQELGYTIVIYTCRSNHKGGVEQVEKYLDENKIPYDMVFEGEKPHAKFYIDDKAIHFDSWDKVTEKVEKSEKTASLTISAYSQRKLWFDPSGQMYDISPSSSHADWILDNKNMLRNDYGFEQTEWYRDSYGAIEDYEGLDNALISKGWSRIGDLYNGWGIQVANIRRVPDYLRDKVSESKGEVIIEDANHDWVSVDANDFAMEGQKAINKALQRKRLQTASLHRKARLGTKYWIDPKGKEYDLSGLDHGSWIEENRNTLESYGFEFPTEYWTKSQGWFEIADTMIKNGWTRVTTESDYDFAMEIADINNLPSYLDTFVAHHYTGGGVEIDDLEGNYQDISDPFPSLRKAIYQAKRLRNAASLKEANYSHAYWLDPNGKIYPVRGDDEEAARRSLDLSNEDTHSGWISKHKDMLQKDYGIDSNSLTSTSSLVELGWTRIGDAYGTDWGIDVSNTDNIPSFVDDAIAQFAPEGSQITVAGPGSARYSPSGFTFEWPVKSIQQKVQQLKNRQSRNPSPNFQVAKQADVAINDPNHPDRQGPPYALFNFIQKGLPEYGIPDLEMYDIFGDHPRFGSTVAKKTVEELGIPIRQGKVAQTKKIKQGEYGALMALVPHNIAQEIVEWGVRNIPDDAVFTSEDNPRLGRELESHITIKYGLLTEDAKHVRRFFNETKPFKAKLGKVRHFEPPEMDFDVVTVEVISDDLNEMNDIVTDEFDCAKGLVSDDYHPHITISYVKRGTGKDFIGATDFEGTKVELDTVIFSPAKGNRTYFKMDVEAGMTIIWKLNKSAASSGPIFIWLSPDGEEFDTPQHSHGAWVEQNMELLKTKYNLTKLSPAFGGDETPDVDWLISKGWTRVTGYLPSEIDLNVADINNVPQAAENYVWAHNPEVVVVEDLNHNDDSFDREEYSKGLSKRADFLPSLVQAPDNDWQFAQGGPDKEIAIDPDAVSDEQTDMAPCTTGKPRKMDMWKSIWHMIKSPFSKNDVEKESAADPEQEKLTQDEMGEDETLLEYSKGFKDLNRQNTNKPKTTWDAGPSKAPNQQEPYSPLPVTLDVTTNPQNENWRYPYKFTRRPVGDQSNQGEVTQALEDMFQNMTASMQKEAEMFEMDSANGKTFSILVNPSLTEVVGLWGRSGSKHLRLLTDETTGDKYIWDGYFATHGEVQKYTGLKDVQGDDLDNLRVIRSIFKQSSVAKKASIEEVNGIKVLVNATPNEIQGMFARSKNEHLRGLIDPLTGDTYVWDGYQSEHDSIIRYFGLDIDWENDDGTYIRHIGGPNDMQQFFQIQQEVKNKLGRRRKKASIEDIDGTPVFVNPSQQELEDFSKRLKGDHTFRGLLDPHTGDLFVWDAYEAIHQFMIQKLGLDIKYSDQSHLALYFSSEHISEVLRDQQEFKRRLGKNKKTAIQKNYALYIGGILMIRTMTMMKAQKILRERYPQALEAGNYEIRPEKVEVPLFREAMYSNTYTDEQGEQFYNEQHMNNTDEEPYVNHDQRDYPGGTHDSPENTDSGIGWAKDNTKQVVLLDQLLKPCYRQYAPGLPEYQVFFFDTLPMSDGSEV